MRDVDWRQLGACKGCDPDMWVTPPKEVKGNEAAIELAAVAMSICRTCPVAMDCARDAKEKGAAGQIRAGVPYDQQGQPAARCMACGAYIVGRRGLAVLCLRHADQVQYWTDKLRSEKVSV